MMVTVLYNGNILAVLFLILKKELIINQIKSLIRLGYLAVADRVPCLLIAFSFHVCFEFFGV